MSVNVGHAAGIVHDPYPQRVRSYGSREGGRQASCVTLFLKERDLRFGYLEKRAELTRGGELIVGFGGGEGGSCYCGGG